LTFFIFPIDPDAAISAAPEFEAGAGVEFDEAADVVLAEGKLLITVVLSFLVLGGGADDISSTATV
jgi:hypothetical protein